MKPTIITRYGVTYPLTQREMFEVHTACQEQTLIEDIHAALEEDEFKVSKPAFTPLEETKIAAAVTKSLSNNDAFWDIYWATIRDCIEQAAQ